MLETCRYGRVADRVISRNDMEPNLKSENDRLQQRLAALREFMNQRIVGQQDLVSRMLVALLADGHVLVEGPPGLAKTRSVKTLADGLEGDFQRIQFTPDLLPADLTGTDVFHAHDNSFSFQPGPLFHQIVLADEINRAPAKVQSALLEAMEERQITVGGTTYALPPLYFVMATQNPIEQEGTYPLPESQLDRFLLKVTVNYPAVDAEVEIMRKVRDEARDQARSAQLPAQLPVTQQEIFAARAQILTLYLAEAVENYIASLVQASRRPQPYSAQLAQWIQYGASPRATLALDRCSRALAWLDGRDYVTPEDVQQLAHETLRHRILLTYRAEADGVSVDDVVTELLERVPVA